MRTVRALSRRDGTWTAAFRHRAYGPALDSAGSVPFELRYRWIGRELDEETGFYYLRARYYDPNSQRFTQEDPIGFGGGANVYAYGDGNPTNGRDLNGLEKDSEFQATSSVSPRLTDMWACMGTTRGCSGGPGLSWTRGESWIGFGWAILTDLERSVAYGEYYRAAKARSAWLRKTSYDGAVRAMTRSEFGRAIDAINPLQGPNAALWTGRIEGALRQGIFFAQTSGTLSCCADGSTAARSEYGEGTAISVIHPNVFNQSLPFIANTFVHETAHMWGGIIGEAFAFQALDPHWQHILGGRIAERYICAIGNQASGIRLC